MLVLFYPWFPERRGVFIPWFLVRGTFGVVSEAVFEDFCLVPTVDHFWSAACGCWDFDWGGEATVFYFAVDGWFRDVCEFANLFDV